VTNTFATAVARDGDELALTLAPRDGSPERTVRVERLLLASGRVPNVEALDLDRVGVEHTRGGIGVDEHMRTSADGIWAAGDVTATIQLTPIAGYQAQVAVDDMFGDGARVADYSALPSAIFTDPELAGVGLTEEQARAEGFDVETASYDAKALIRPYSSTTRRTACSSSCTSAARGGFSACTRRCEEEASCSRATRWRSGLARPSTTSRSVTTPSRRTGRACT